ncbi:MULTISPECIES: hypothetical protein [unclassified Gordonia (in: high G+C Gram-positive bacteria)]
MSFTLRRLGLGLATTAITLTAVCGGASIAHAAPLEGFTYTPCSQKFRTPVDLTKPERPIYLSPYGTAGIYCFTISGNRSVTYLQRGPLGDWHYMYPFAPNAYYMQLIASYPPSTTKPLPR